MSADNERAKDLGGFFAVSPKTDCPHIHSLYQDINSIRISTPCLICNDPRENWVCLQCGSVLCSRYVNSHMSEHSCETSHHLALSFSDLSFWCYLCDSYIVSNELRPTLKALQDQKFPNLNNNY